MLYKYRDASNLEFVLDILVNQRLWAAPFESLNDPMEGAYRFAQGTLTPEQTQSIYGMKSEWHLLSLSRTDRNVLLWSYYANGHTGVAIGVDIVETPDVEIEPVHYVQNLEVHGFHLDLGKEILSRKLAAWTHEEETRVFKRRRSAKAKGSYVSVKVKDLVIGVKCPRRTSDLVSKVAREFCPGIRITKLTMDSLDRGQVPAL